MQPEEFVPINATRVDPNGWLCMQFEPDSDWYIPALGLGFRSLAEMEEAQGPTRPVRIVTTDPRLQSELDEARSVIAQMFDESPAGLSPQEIQGRARQHGRQLARRYGLDPGVGELAGHIAADIAGWVRDGSVPDATA